VSHTVPTGPAPGENEPEEGPLNTPQCSAKGCRNDATTDLRWRNPRLHDAARVKHWLACDEHVATLGSFLSARGFLLGQEPLG
jgi:hypothetical protein